LEKANSRDGSGFGKSTQLSLMAGPNPPRLARSRVQERNLAEWKTDELARWTVGLVLQSFNLPIIFSLAAGLYPAARAARLNPVEAPRNK